jgi:hypothetical protein
VTAQNKMAKKDLIKGIKDLAGEEIKLVEPETEKVLKEYGKEFNKLHLEFVERVILLIIVGLGVITALAWDEALKNLFNLIFTNLTSVQEKFLYATLLTIITATATVFLNKYLKKQKRKTKKKKK